MGTVYDFYAARARRQRFCERKPADKPAGPAEIHLFTGVRQERWGLDLPPRIGTIPHMTEGGALKRRDHEDL